MLFQYVVGLGNRNLLEMLLAAVPDCYCCRFIWLCKIRL
jgi:hypothetical protein